MILILETNSTSRIKIKGDGNVGIGTTSPTTKLYVHNGEATIASATDGVKLSYSNGNSSGIIDTAFSDNNLEFRTNGTAKMWIANGGNVGIGTTSPAEKLNIYTATGRNFKVNQSTANVTILENDYELELRSGGGYDLKLNANGSSTYGNVTFRTDGTERMRINSSGNVGIGTTSPQKKLDVYLGTNNAVASIAGGISSGEYAGLHFGYSETGNSNYRHSAIVFERDDASHGDARGKIHILNSASGSSSADLGDSRLTILPSGNVGIGTTSPSHKLHVSGSGTIVYAGGSASNNEIVIERTTSSPSKLQLQAFSSNPSIKFTANGNGRLRFLDSSDNERVTFLESGNVGIGTTSPREKLDVDGDIVTTWGNDKFVGLQYQQGAAYQNGLLLHGDNRSTGLIAKGGTGSTPYIWFGVSEGGNTERMRITKDGNVGIGTTNPGAKLHVDSSTAFSLTAATGDTLFLSDDTSTSELNGVGASIGFSGPQAVQRQAAIAALRTGDDHDKIGLAFYTHPGSGNDETIVEKLRIDHDGNVGIGTASPGEKLEVAGNIKIGDSNVMYLGAGNDLQIYHDGSNSYITDTGTGNLLITSNGASVQINKGLTENMAEFIVDGAVNLYYDSAKKFETTSTGATVSGALAVSGKITNLTAGTGNLDAVNVQQLNNATTGTLIYKGTWSAAPTTTSVLDGAISGAGSIVIEAANPGISVGATITGTGISGTVTVSNIAADGITIAISSAQTIADGVTLTFTTVGGTPDLSQASRKVTGHYYICETAGAVTPNGAGTTPNEWAVGDWATFSDLTTDAWQKIDNSSVLSGAGTGGKVPVWSGTGTSVTLADAPITVSGNNATFAGNVAMVTGNSTGKFAVKSAGVHASYDFYNNGTSYFNGGVVVDAGFSQTGGADVTFTGDVAISSTMPKLTFTDLQQDDWRIMNDNGDFRFTNIDGSGHALILATNNNATFAGDVTVGGKTYPKISLTDNQGVARTFSVGTNNETFTVRNETASSDAFTISNANNATFAGDVTVNGSHLTLANGTTSAAATDYLYIGGDGLASADAAIYIGNGGGNTVDGYGYRIYYSGAGAGNNNKLIFKSENYQSAEIDMLTFTADGKSTFSQDATFAGEATFNGSDGHINLDGNNAVIFDNSNNNNAWYIRNGGSNAATLQMGTGSSPGSDIKLTLNSSGDATFAGSITAGGDITATGADFTLAHAAGATVYLRRDDTSISDGNVLGLINFQGDDPTNGTFNTGVALMGRAAGDWASGSYESEFILQTRNTSGGLVTALTVNEAQNATFAGTASATRFQGTTYPYNTTVGHTANATTTYIEAGSSSKTSIELSGGDVNSNIKFITPNASNVETLALTIDSSQNATFAGSIDTTAVNIKVGTAIHGTITSSSNSLTLNARNTGKLIFQSGGAEKMRINGTNVGIGTTDPKSKLQVAGGIQMAGDTAAASADKVGTMRYRTGTEYVEVNGTELVTNGDFAGVVKIGLKRRVGASLAARLVMMPLLQQAHFIKAQD